jgi:hypothetical protein
MQQSHRERRRKREAYDVIEGHDDVGSELVLRLDATLGREHHLCAVVW